MEYRVGDKVKIRESSPGLRQIRDMFIKYYLLSSSVGVVSEIKDDKILMIVNNKKFWIGVDYIILFDKQRYREERLKKILKLDVRE